MGLKSRRGVGGRPRSKETPLSRWLDENLGRGCARCRSLGAAWCGRRTMRPDFGCSRDVPMAGIAIHNLRRARRGAAQVTWWLLATRALWGGAGNLVVIGSCETVRPKTALFQRCRPGRRCPTRLGNGQKKRLWFHVIPCGPAPRTRDPAYHRVRWQTWS